MTKGLSMYVGDAHVRRKKVRILKESCEELMSLVVHKSRGNVLEIINTVKL